MRRGCGGEDDLGGVASQCELESPAVAGEIGCPWVCSAREACGSVLAYRRVRQARGASKTRLAVGDVEDAMGGRSRSARRGGCPREREDGDRVVGAGHDSPVSRGGVERNHLIRVGGGRDEVSERCKKGTADLCSGRAAEGGQNEADSAGLLGGLGVDAEGHGIDDARCGGLELGDAAVAAILNGIVDVAEGVVARDLGTGGVSEDEGRRTRLSHRSIKSSKCEKGESQEHFGGGIHFSWEWGLVTLKGIERCGHSHLNSSGADSRDDNNETAPVISMAIPRHVIGRRGSCG